MFLPYFLLFVSMNPAFNVASSTNINDESTNTNNSSLTSSSNILNIQDVSFKERSIQEFSNRRDYVWAMREDIAAWFESVKNLKDTTASNLFNKLATGEVLCEHANCIYEAANNSNDSNFYNETSNNVVDIKILNSKPTRKIARYQTGIKSVVSPIGANRSRDNLSQFLNFCKNELKFRTEILFESNDILEESLESPEERNVIVCLIELIRVGGYFGIEVSDFLKLEQDLDDEENEGLLSESVNNSLTHCSEYDEDSKHDDSNSQSQPNNNDPKPNNPDFKESVKLPKTRKKQTVSEILKDVHTGVKNELKKCTCPEKFELVKMVNYKDPKKGKYRLGNSGTTLLMRILRDNILVRVGGGWDTLDSWLLKHDPCRKGSKRVSGGIIENSVNNKRFEKDVRRSLSPNEEKSKKVNREILIKKDEEVLEIKKSKHVNAKNRNNNNNKNIELLRSKTDLNSGRLSLPSRHTTKKLLIQPSTGLPFERAKTDLKVASLHNFKQSKNNNNSSNSTSLPSSKKFSSISSQSLNRLNSSNYHKPRQDLFLLTSANRQKSKIPMPRWYNDFK